LKIFIRFSLILFILLFSINNAYSQLFAGFTATSEKVGCTPFHAVDFENTSVGTFHYVGWDFDADGSIDLEGFPGLNSNINTPTWPFQIAGMYSIRLLIRDTVTGQESESTINDYIISNQSPMADFEGNPQIGCGSQVVTFADLSVAGDADIISWSWDFGNGIVSGLPSPVITYSNVTGILQKYNVSLILVDGNECTSNESKSEYIEIEPGVIPDFILEPSDTCAPSLIVEITNMSTGIEPLTYSWDFGNGETSDLENPGPIIYTEFGTFDVTLTLSNPNCEAELTKVVAIANNLGVSFEYFSNCEGKITQFHNISADAYDTFKWDFGDGSATSSEENPTHTYTVADVYNVELTVSIGEVACENSIIEEVQVFEPDTIQYDKDTTYVVCEVGQTISIPILNDNIFEFSWELVDSDGDPVFWGDDTFVSMTFTEDQPEGDYFLSMYALFDTNCEDSTASPIPIFVSFPIIGGIVGPDMGCVPIDISFVDTSSYEYGIDSVMWFFGSGNDTTAGDFIYTYTDTGFYLVSLTVFTSVGCNVNEPIDTLGTGMHTYPEFIWPHPDTLMGEDTIKICYNEILEWIYTGPDTSAYEGADTSRTDTIDPHTWFWTGSISSMDENPMTGFTSPDTGYFVTLITTHFGCADTINHFIDSIIGVGPEPEFVMDPTFFCLTDTAYEVTFTNKSIFDTLNSTIQWNFGDGAISTDLDPPPHTYLNPGEYFPSLSIESVIQIEFAPEPESFLTCEVTFPGFYYSVYIDTYQLFSVNAATFDFCDDGNAVLSANVSSPIFPPEYSQNIWDFGDGSEPIVTFSNDELAIHEYDSAGVYELIVVGSNGICFDTIKQEVNVYKLPQAEFLYPTDTLCAALTDSIQLFDSSIPGDLDITGWEYLYFPGGALGTQDQNPWVKIIEPVNYTFKLTVTDEFGCESKPFTHSIEINDLDILVPDTFTCNNSIMEIDYFNIKVDYLPLTYDWVFGNGETDTTATPMVGFMGIQNDTVFDNFVTFTDATGCPQTEEFEIEVTLPQMSWEQEFDIIDCDSSGFVARFFFTVTSTDTNIDTIIMNFGDGSFPAIIDTIEQAVNYPHTYTTPGIFDVTFTVIDENECSNTVFLEDYVHVEGPMVDPSWSTRDLCPPLKVQFVANDTSGIDSYLWHFGDGFTNDLSNPSHDYKSSGVFIPELWASATFEDANGAEHTCTIKYNNMDTIFIDGPVLNFDFVDENQCLGTLSEINNLSENSDVFGAVQWQWDFGDDSPIEIQNTIIPIDPEPHDFEDSGPFVITLTALSEDSVCVYRKDTTVVVIPPLDLDPFRDYPPGCVTYDASFLPDQGDLINQIIDPLWEFGDGGTSDSLTPEHPYTEASESPGYIVTLTYLTEECEFMYTYEDPIVVYPIPIAGFTFEPNVDDNAVISYGATNQSEGYESIKWLLDDVFFSSDNQITVPVKKEKTMLTLIAFTDKGCTDTTEALLEGIEPVNIITPNNDMINDALFFQLSEDQMQCTGLNVFNRWGKLVYSASTYFNDWKGTNNSGNDLDEGTYFYVLSICGEGAIKGYVTIVR
jgi:gliding motility-associated-like protein